MTTQAEQRVVFDRVRRCLEQVGGGSGHLASYHLDPETFVITARDQLGADEIEYAFTVEGYRLGEFETADDSSQPSSVPDHEAAERLEGTIVLDADGDFTTDRDGRVRIDPWTTTLDPDAGADDGIDALLEDLDRRRD